VQGCPLFRGQQRPDLQGQLGAMTCRVVHQVTDPVHLPQDSLPIRRIGRHQGPHLLSSRLDLFLHRAHDLFGLRTEPLDLLGHRSVQAQLGTAMLDDEVQGRRAAMGTRAWRLGMGGPT